MEEKNIVERIKEKAHELFTAYGLRSVSMDNISSDLGISKKTIYQYFENKDNLVESVIQDIIDQSKKCCSIDKLQAQDAIQEILLSIEMFKSMFENINKSVMYDLEKFHVKAFEMVIHHKYHYLKQVLLENMNWGIAEGLYRSEINKEIIIKIRLENMLLVFNNKLFPSSQFEIVSIANELTKHYLYGIATLKGHKLLENYILDRK